MYGPCDMSVFCARMADSNAHLIKPYHKLFINLVSIGAENIDLNLQGGVPFNRSKSGVCVRKLDFQFHLWTNQLQIAI